MTIPKTGSIISKNNPKWVLKGGYGEMKKKIPIGKYAITIYNVDNGNVLIEKEIKDRKELERYIKKLCKNFAK